jgi:hypothetical protein
MLKRVRIQGYRCFRNVEVELKPLQILVGPNRERQERLPRCDSVCGGYRAEWPEKSGGAPGPAPQ